MIAIDRDSVLQSAGWQTFTSLVNQNDRLMTLMLKHEVRIKRSHIGKRASAVVVMIQAFALILKRDPASYS